ncbi:MAG: ABC transporter ATP-binding protein [Gemmatimonadota bacterium]|nr:ABC transporter ATP-binding protein [Gemmatimonadota bacterium]
MNSNFSRFIRTYVRPFRFRVVLVMGLAGISGSYFYVLGFITKTTVDDVLQIRPLAEETSRGRSNDGPPADSAEDPAARDPERVLPHGWDVDRPAPTKSRTEKIQWLWAVFALYLTVRFAFAGLTWLYNYNIAFVGNRIVYRVRLDLHQKVQKLQMTFFDRKQTGKIMSRILDDVQLLESEVTTTLVEAIGHMSKIVIGIVVLLLINVELAVLAFLALPLYAITYKLFQRPVSETFARMREAYSDTYGVLEERVRGIRVVYSFAKERYERRMFFKRLVTIFRLSIRNSMLNASLRAACASISAIAVALILYWGALMVRSGDLTVGELIFFNMSLSSLFMPLVALANVNMVFRQMAVVVSRVFEVLDEEISIRDRPNAIPLKQLRGRVIFRNVRFQYSPVAGDVLEDLTFSVQAGASVAVVGPSGAGKSTLLSLLLRLYEPTGGSILLDDYDLRDVRLSSIRRHVSMVPQEPVLFSGTIAQNIVYGRDGATPDQIMEAAGRAELHDFIMSLPEKYEYMVEEGGGNLSGGQKQRLALAMALLTDPAILILDDTTSALDAGTEARIQETLDRVMAGRTTFVITHRISTAARAERILVLDRGRMAGWGTHEELLSRGGVYGRLYDEQQRPEGAFAGGSERGITGDAT